MKRVHNNPLGNDLWFDGNHYWRGRPGNLIGPFGESELHDIKQQESITGDDSTVIDAGEITATPKE
jgi:hypothetical protein